jgi:hypothetical protein
MKYFKNVLLVLFILLGAGLSLSQEMETPVEVQVPIFLKVLTFDRNFSSRVGDEIVCAVVYQKKFRKSLNVKNQFREYIKKSAPVQVEDIPFRYIEIDLHGLLDFEERLKREKVDVLYLTPLRAVSIESLVTVSRSLGITTLTGVPGYCEAGAAVSIGTRGGAPLIIINHTGAVSEGADFSSQLLKLAKVIGKNGGG